MSARVPPCLSPLHHLWEDCGTVASGGAAAANERCVYYGLRRRSDHWAHGEQRPRRSGRARVTYIVDEPSVREAWIRRAGEVVEEYYAALPSHRGVRTPATILAAALAVHEARS